MDGKHRQQHGHGKKCQRHGGHRGRYPVAIHRGGGSRGACPMEKTLDVIPCDLGEVLPYLVQVTKPKTDTCAGLASVQDICRHSQIFKVTDEAGNTVAAYAVEPYEHDRGTMLFVTAGAGAMPGIDLSLTMCKVVEAQAIDVGAKAIGLMTKRGGMIRKLKAQGWTVAGLKMVKKL